MDHPKETDKVTIPRTARLGSKVSLVGIRKTEILCGWKSIAKFMGRKIRTVQRYERELDLPIRRPGRTLRASVLAVKAELAGWVSAIPFRGHSLPKREHVGDWASKLKADSPRIDCEIGQSLYGTALDATDQQKRRRATQAARQAHDTVMQLRKDVELGGAEIDKLGANVKRLKRKLQSLAKAS
jgi:hypothetical protein